MKKYLLFLLMANLIMVPNVMMAQDKEMGIIIGYGLTGMTDNEPLVNLSDYRFRHDSPNVMVAGLTFSDQILWTPLSYNTGISYFNKELYQTGNAHYINIPAGIEYLFGKKLKFGVGGGLYLNTHLGSKYSSSLRTFVLGKYLKVSTGYQLNDNYRIMFSWSGSSDITNMSRWSGSGYTGSTRFEELIGFDSVFALGLVYRLKARADIPVDKK